MSSWPNTPYRYSSLVDVVFVQPFEEIAASVTGKRFEAFGANRPRGY